MATRHGRAERPASAVVPAINALRFIGSSLLSIGVTMRRHPTGQCPTKKAHTEPSSGEMLRWRLVQYVLGSVDQRRSGMREQLLRFGDAQSSGDPIMHYSTREVNSWVVSLRTTVHRSID